MGSCVPATEIFGAANKQHVSSSSSTALTNALLSSGSPTLSLALPTAPPNLPAPAASPHHPVHAAHMARSSYPPATSSTPVHVSERPQSVATVHHAFPMNLAQYTASEAAVTSESAVTAVSSVVPDSPTFQASVVRRIAAPDSVVVVKAPTTTTTSSTNSSSFTVPPTTVTQENKTSSSSPPFVSATSVNIAPKLSDFPKPQPTSEAGIEESKKSSEAVFTPELNGSGSPQLSRTEVDETDSKELTKATIESVEQESVVC